MVGTEPGGKLEMDVRVINPFIGAIEAVLSNEIGSTVRRGGPPAITAGSKLPHEVTAIIGVTGDLAGLLLISMPTRSALKFYELIVGEKKDELDDIVRSAIAELSNTVTGTASIELENQGLVVDISPPAVIQGVDAQLTTLNTSRVAVPLETKLGPVTVEIALSRVRSTSE